MPLWASMLLAMPALLCDERGRMAHCNRSGRALLEAGGGLWLDGGLLRATNATGTGLLDVRRVVGLRNPAHSLVKLMVPVQGPAVLVSSYTHPEYLHSMTDTLALTHTTALLLRGTEGEPVADARRTPAMDAFTAGQATRVQEAQAGPLAQVPELPSPDPLATATYIRRVLTGQVPVPTPIATQVRQVLALVAQAPNLKPATLKRGACLR